jgi:hypothetical protein
VGLSGSSFRRERREARDIGEQMRNVARQMTPAEIDAASRIRGVARRLRPDAAAASGG